MASKTVKGTLKDAAEAVGRKVAARLGILAERKIEMAAACCVKIVTARKDVDEDAAFKLIRAAMSDKGKGQAFDQTAFGLSIRRPKREAMAKAFVKARKTLRKKYGADDTPAVSTDAPATVSTDTATA